MSLCHGPPAASSPTLPAGPGLDDTGGRIQRLQQAGVRFFGRDNETLTADQVRRRLAGDQAVSVRTDPGTVPLSLRGPQDLDFLAALHLGEGEDPLAAAVTDLCQHGFTVLEQRTGPQGAPVDRLALYRNASGVGRSGRVTVRPRDLRSGLDVYTPEAVKALAFMHGSGTDYGLSRPELAHGLARLAEADFRIRRYPSESPSVVAAPQRYEAFQAYAEVTDRRQEVLWLSRGQGPSIPVPAALAEDPAAAASRYELACSLAGLLPEGLSANQQEDFWALALLPRSAGETDRDLAERARALARMVDLTARGGLGPVQQAARDLEMLQGLLGKEQLEAGLTAFLAVRAQVGAELAREGAVLLPLRVEGESLEQRAELWAEVARGPAGAAGATPTDRRVEYVREAIQRFAARDPAAARQRLSTKLLLPGQPAPAEAAGPSSSVGVTPQGDLVVGGVVVRRRPAGDPSS